MSKESAEISVILATYNRPETLKAAVQSVLYQTYPHWKLYVIGDCCDERTQTVMAHFEEDPRVFYINLSSRTGSQALPNSVGMNLATTPYIAFLNHDDIWLSDHLEIALEHLKDGTSDFFLGSSLVISGIQEDRSGELKMTIRMKTGYNRKLEDCFNNYHIFEPASSWVMHKTLAEKTGPWKSPYSIYRFPSQDWLMRAWRAGAKLSTDARYTSLKMEDHLINEGQKNLYDSSSQIHFRVFNYLMKNSADDTRENIIYEQSGKSLKQTQKGFWKNRTLASLRKSILKLKFFTWVYYFFGFDVDEWLNKFYGRQTGSNWVKLLYKRTNEKTVTPPPLSELTLEARNKLSKKRSDN